MSIQTKVVWEDSVRTEQLKEVIAAEVGILVQQGKTDGINVQTQNDPIAGQNSNIRTWIDQPTAEGWIIFINSLQIPPVSTAILSE
jgi:hypothetical protein